MATLQVMMETSEEEKGCEPTTACVPVYSPERPLSVKSTAVLKYSFTEIPATYAQLQHNTNLNLPPANWLRQADKWHGFPFSCTASDHLTSFRMANMFTDCITEVDVVSDAENIKKLLKIPYSKRSVSMMVHRIGNTLLIDEFDIHRHLLRRAETEWEWLKKFYMENILKSMGEQKFCRKNKSRDNLQHKSLVSKFLYHSLMDKSTESEEGSSSSGEHSKDSPVPVSTKEKLSRLPGESEDAASTGSNPQFARNVLWTFEDIQMLIGTDMPIFGSGTHPCVSLRLRDMSKPISVLTGIDYWLDNLMCNVPEVVMCYHLEGIVQKYELIKTEDLPHMDSSKFSPKVIRDIAQHILSFLKANATKAGHTYWLFKAKNDDVVKLYDLSSLGMQVSEDQDQNPFTVPVGLLLYRVGCNMMKHSHDGKKKHSTIRALLINCLSLLNPEKHPKEVASAHYMLSELYVPESLDPASPHVSDEEDDDNDSEQWDDCEGWEEEAVGDVRVPTLCTGRLIPHRVVQDKYRPPPIVGSLQERCQEALVHVVGALDCIHMSQKKGAGEESQPRMAHPFQPIPMPYKTSPPPPQAETWEDSLRFLLLQKTVLIMGAESELNTRAHNPGRSLHLLRLAMLSCLEVHRVWGVYPTLRRFLLEQLGEAFLILTTDWDRKAENTRAYRQCTEPERKLAKHLLASPELIPNMPQSREEALQGGIYCFEEAVDALAEDKKGQHRVRSKIAGVYNELANTYLQYTMDIVTGSGTSTGFVETLFAKSSCYFESSVKQFKEVGDKLNASLVASNKGKLMRTMALFTAKQSNASKSQDEMGVEGDWENERLFHIQAQTCYRKALRILGVKENGPMAWELINRELHTTMYCMAERMQHCYRKTTGKVRDDSDREISELYHQSLKLCEDDKTCNWQARELRIGTIYRQLGNLYLSSSLVCTGGERDDSRRRLLLQQSRTHYANATDTFTYIGSGGEILRIYLDKALLLEENGVNDNKSLPSALDTLLQAAPAVQMLTEARGEREEERKLLVSLRQALQGVLLKLTKANSKRGEKGQAWAEAYKKMYAVTLCKEADPNDVIKLATRLTSVLKQLRDMQKDVEKRKDKPEDAPKKKK